MYFDKCFNHCCIDPKASGDDSYGMNHVLYFF